MPEQRCERCGLRPRRWSYRGKDGEPDDATIGLCHRCADEVRPMIESLPAYKDRTLVEVTDA